LNRWEGTCNGTLSDAVPDISLLEVAAIHFFAVDEEFDAGGLYTLLGAIDNLHYYM
jgi:hypothetical protein